MRRPAAAAAALAALAALAAFSPALFNGYVAYDDLEAVVYNDRIRSLSWESLRWMLTSFEQSTWQPLPWLVYALLHAAAGTAPAAYHLFMLVLHAVNAALVAGLAFTLLSSAGAAAFAGALFAVHPVQTESVVSAASISDIMAATFALAALLAYARAPEGRRPAAAWAFFALGCLCRWQAASAALALPLLDWARGRKLRVARYAPFLAAAAALGLVYARVKATDLEAARRLDLGAAAAGAFVYVQKLLAPSAYLPFYYVVPPAAPWNALYPAVLAALTAGLAYLSRRSRAPLAAWLFFLAVVAPTLVLRRDELLIARERYVYVAFLGVYLSAAAGGLWLWRRAKTDGRRAGLATAAAILLFSFAQTSWSRARAWRDAETFWTAALAVEPRLYIARPHVGAARVRNGDWKGAADVFVSQLGEFPADRRGAYLLAVALAHGVPDASFGPAAALGVRPKTAREKAALLSDLSLELTSAGLYELAAAYGERSVALDADNPKARHNLAYALAKLGRREEAAKHLRVALALAPSQAISRGLLDRIR